MQSACFQRDGTGRAMETCTSDTLHDECLKRPGCKGLASGARLQHCDSCGFISRKDFAGNGQTWHPVSDSFLRIFDGTSGSTAMSSMSNSGLVRTAKPFGTSIKILFRATQGETPFTRYTFEAQNDSRRSTFATEGSGQTFPGDRLALFRRNGTAMASTLGPVGAAGGQCSGSFRYTRPRPLGRTASLHARRRGTFDRGKVLAVWWAGSHCRSFLWRRAGVASGTAVP